MAWGLEQDGVCEAPVTTSCAVGGEFSPIPCKCLLRDLGISLSPTSPKHSHPTRFAAQQTGQILTLRQHRGAPPSLWLRPALPRCKG